MLTAFRLFAVAAALAVFGLTPVRSGPVPCDAMSAVMLAPGQFPGDSLETRVATLEANIQILTNTISQLERKIDGLADPLTQAPKRTAPTAIGGVAAVAAPVVAGVTLKRLANGQTVMCTESGCTVVSGQTAVAVTAGCVSCDSPLSGGFMYASGGSAMAFEIRENRPGPIRRALFGRYR